MTGRVLLTGATGLIGSWVVRHWPAAGPELVPVGSADADLLRQGAPGQLLDATSPTDVVHLAWSASGHPDYRHSEANTRWLAATLELTAAARQRGVRLWLTGTVVDEVTGDAPEVVDPYSHSKGELRRLVTPDIEAGAIGWFRPFYVVDESWRRPALVAQAMAAAQTGVALELRSPEALHDFIHASDVGAAVVLAVTNGIGGYLPLGSGRLRQVADLVVALGARWQCADAAAPRVHSHTPADTRWLAVRGWSPTRTQELFGDE